MLDLKQCIRALKSLLCLSLCGTPVKEGHTACLSWRGRQLPEPFLPLLSLTPPPSLILALEKFSCYCTAGCSAASELRVLGREALLRGAAYTATSLQQHPSVHLQHKSSAGRAGNGGISVPPTLCLPSENLTVLHLIMRSTYAMNKILVQSGEYTLGVFVRKGIWNKAGIEHGYYFR